MKVSRLVIKNFQGVQELDARPGDLTLVAGRNGAGKTSILSAITAAVTSARGERPRLVRDEAGESFVLLELDDGHVVRRTIEDNGRTAGPVVVTDGTGREVSAAQRFLSSVGAGFGFDPLAFVALPPQEQTKRLLEVVPADVPMPELIKLGGGRLPEVDYTQHPLQVLTALGKVLEEKRRVAGRDARDSEGMAAKLRADVPTDFNPVTAQAFDLTGAYETIQRRDEAARQAERAAAHVGEVSGKVELVRRQLEDLEQQLTLAEAQRDDASQVLQDLLSGTDFHALDERIKTYETDRQHLDALRNAEQREQQAAELREQYTLLSERIEQVRRKPGEILAAAGLPVEGLGG
jgi:DNA repair ATPase RecN